MLNTSVCAYTAAYAGLTGAPLARDALHTAKSRYLKGSLQMTEMTADVSAYRADMLEAEMHRQGLAAPINDSVTLIASLSAIEIEYRRRANVAARILEGIELAHRRGRSPDLEDLYAARTLGECLMEAGPSTSPGAEELARHHDNLWTAADELITLRSNDERY